MIRTAVHYATIMLARLFLLHVLPLIYFLVAMRFAQRYYFYILLIV